MAYGPCLPGSWKTASRPARRRIRETLEEACARVDIDQLFSLVNVPHINQVHLFYRARLLDTGFAAGLETLETALFTEEDPSPGNRSPSRASPCACRPIFPTAGAAIQFPRG
jgi:hypothetical protein